MLVLTLSSLAAATAARPVAAQAAGPAHASTAPPASRVVTLDEVVVTANRRREPSREVPMHVDSVSARRLEETGAASLADYTTYVPGVFFASQGGPGEGTLVMRGVATGNQTSPTVAVYIDDVPVGGSTVYSAAATFVFDDALMDINHVEFLFGPQGTLYGAGSMGGLVKYVTNKPDPGDFAARVGLGLSETARGGFGHTERGMLNLPLSTDVAALRVSAIERQTPGVYRAVGETPARHADSSRTRGARAQLRIYPGADSLLDLTAMTQKIRADGLSMADYSLDGVPLSGGRFDRRLNHREPYAQTLDMYVLHAAHTLPWASLDWISSYQTFANRSVQDYPDRFLSLLNALGPLFGVQQQLSTLYVDSLYTVHKATQEFRVTSTSRENVEWLAGVWLSREDGWEQFALLGDNLPPPPGQTHLLGQRVNSRFQEYAGYGDATWHLAPSFDFTFGARWSGNTQTLANVENGPVAGSPGGFREHRAASNLTGLLTASYRPDKRHSYYLRASSGYRPGGLQAPVVSTIFGANANNVTDSFASDNLASYEAGFKGSFLDQSLSLGADVYDIEWHNLQVPTYTVGNAVIVNIGDARVQGAEIQLDYTPGNWRFDGSTAYTDGRITRSRAQSGIAAGSPLPYSARWAATMRARRIFHLHTATAYAGITLRATSRRHAGFANDPSDPDFLLPGHALWDLNAGFHLRTGTRIDFYLRNVFNRHVPVGTLNTQTVGFLSTVGGPMLVHLTSPRTLGVSVEVPFR